MDSNRRHQLSQNLLANWFITQYEEWIQPNSNLLSGVILVILLLFVAYFGYAKMTEWGNARSWDKYYTALHSENAENELEALADTAKGSFADQARLTLAQIQLGDGCNKLFEDKTTAIERIEKAVEQFQRVQRAQDAQLRLQAGFGLAQAWETLAAARVGKDDLSEAEKEYKNIADQSPNDYLGQKAKKQLALIARSNTKKFLELAAAKAVEKPKADDFKVDINKTDPFLNGPGGFDVQKSLGGSSQNDFLERAVDMDVKPAEQPKYPPVEQPQEQPKEQQPVEQPKAE